MAAMKTAKPKEDKLRKESRKVNEGVNLGEEEEEASK